MAALHPSPCFLLLPSHKLFLNPEGFKISFNALYYPPRKDFRICVSSPKTSRRGKRVKSDSELCNDIREFVSAVGLPEGHVPTMKELSAHGRTDLAYIVRRRGYKFIRDLLSNSVEEESNGFHMEKKLAIGQDTASYHAGGQEEKVEHIHEDSSLSTEIPIFQDCSSSAGLNTEANNNVQGCMFTESSVNESLQSLHGEWLTDEVKSMVKEITSPTPSYIMEQRDDEVRHGVVEERSLLIPLNNAYAEWQSNKVESMVEEISFSTASCNLEQDAEVQDEVEDSSLLTPSGDVPSEWQSNELQCTVKDISSSAPSYDVKQQDEEFQSRFEDNSLSTFSDNVDIEWESNEVKSIRQQITALMPLYDVEQQQEEVQHGIEDNSLLTPSNNIEKNDKDVLSRGEYNSLQMDVLIVDSSPSNLNACSETKSDVINCTPIETSVNDVLEEKTPKNFQCQDEKLNSMDQEISLPTGVSCSNHTNFVDIVPGPNSGDLSVMPVDSTANSSLEDKVAKFIQNGDLDAMEDDVYDMLDKSTEASKEFNENENEIEIRPEAPSEESFEYVVSRSNATSALNGCLLTPEQFTSVRANHWVRNDGLSTEGLASSDIGEDMDDEGSKRENQVEVNHLKFLLHQKELELSHLKEQIEKEKLALSELQTKAETEISKAQKLVSEKDAELLSAEESLSGLVEVNIQYSGDGEIVEVAGSFSGWHHPIKMDPRPSSSNVDCTGSRKSRLWSTMLWLYPGVYEIKFIVDGHWTLDPERESVTKGGIRNNILRVVG